MRFLTLLCVLIAAPIAYAQPVAVIDAPVSVGVGDLVVVDGSKSVGDNHLWVIDERLKGRYLEIPQQRRVVFAIGTPGKYTFQIIVADKEAGISQTVHTVSVGVPVTPPVTPPVNPPPVVAPGPTPPPVVPEPPKTSVSEVSRAAAEKLNDPATASALHAALVAVVSSPPASLEQQRLAVQDAIAKVLASRAGVSRNKDWLNDWRIPVNAEIEKHVSDSNYISLISQVADGLAPKSQETPIVTAAKPRIVIFGNDGCKYCVDWKTYEKPRLEKQGWDIGDEEDKVNPVPYFDIYIRGKRIRHQGYLTMQQLKEYMGQ